MTREEALARVDLRKLLEDVGESRGLRDVRGMYACPDLAHVQRGETPPVSVKERGGIDVWYCHACMKGGCYVEALVACGRARDVADAMDQLGISKPKPAARAVPIGDARPVAWYEYTDEQGEPLYRVVRYEPKTFRQERREDSQWKSGLTEDVRLVPYRLPKVLEAIARDDWVFIVEGEKDVEALERQGRTATTNAGGDMRWLPEFAGLLGPRARVVIVADDDDAGYRHARDVKDKLYGKVGIVQVRRPGEGFKDVSEMVDAGVQVDSTTTRPLPEPAVSNGNGSISGALMLTARAMAARPRIGDALHVVGPLFQRGMRTTIGAQTGDGKSTFALQAIASLVNNEPFLDPTWKPPRPGRALIVDLEQGEETVKRRLHEAGLADTEAVDVLWEPAGLALDSDAAHQALVRDTIRAGNYDLVLLDPLYQMHRGDSNTERTAADLMRLVDGWAREFNFSLVIPMHARKPHPMAGSKLSINEIAGSASWNRNAEFVIALKVMSAGHSKLWFFKDRVGDGPDLQTFWWLSFARADGFARTYQEDRDVVRKALADLLDRDEGASREELAAVGGDDLAIKAALKKAEERNGRYRTRPWMEQTAMRVDGGDDV